MQSSNQTFIQSIIYLCLGTFIICASGLTMASKGGETSDEVRVVTLNTEQLSVIKGSKISSYSLAAVKAGRMTAIPYQFDERTQSGYIYMKELDEKAQKDDPILGNEGFF